MEKHSTIPVRGLPLHLVTNEHGFTPSTASMLLAENFRVKRGEQVCDLGTGNGLQSIVAAKLGAVSVTATEVNPHDVTTAKKNLVLNGISRKVTIYQGDLFDPLPAEQTFDVVLANLPQTPVAPEQITDPAQLGFYAGGDGTTFVLRAIAGCTTRLRPGGRAYFQIDSLANQRGVEAALREHGFDFRIIASVDAPLRYFEMEQLSTFDRLKRDGKAQFHSVCGVLVCRKTIYEAVLRP